MAVQVPVRRKEDFLKIGFDLKSGGKGKKTLWTQRHLKVVKRAFSSN